RVLKSEAFHLSTADGAKIHLKSIDPVTAKISWTEQEKNTDASLLSLLVALPICFTADDEVFHVRTYNKAFDDSTRVLKSEAFQLSTADEAKSHLKSIDPVTAKISWTEQEKNTDATLRTNLIGSDVSFTADDEVFH